MISQNDMALAMSNCDREPIQTPGTIQSYGGLIATDQSLERVSHVSANLSTFLSCDPAESLEKPLEGLLPNELIHNLRNASGIVMSQNQRQYLGACDLGEQLVDLSLHQSGDRMIIECDPLIPTQGKVRSPSVQMYSMLNYLRAEASSEKMLDRATVLLKHMTGFDRAMIYRFLPDASGEVIRESSRQTHTSYLGLRYPASDVPTQVRELALQMPVRNIVSNSEPPVSLLSQQSPLDLSFSYLRGVSPIHAEYLTNMGVEATLTLTIVVQGKLWGLFSCHHYEPKTLSADARLTCELFSQLFSVKLQQALANERIQEHRRVIAATRILQETPKDQFNFATSAQPMGQLLCPLVKADGLAVIAQQQVDTWGDTLAPELVLELIQQCQAQPNSEITPIEQLRQLPRFASDSLDSLAGALVLTISQSEQLYLVFFRKAVTANIRWGGNPEKEVIQGRFGPRLRPRASFDEYIESVTGKCSPWSTQDINIALEVRSLLFELVVHHTETLRRESLRRQKQQDLLIAELNHRVKNVLALMSSIVRQSQDSALTVSDYALILERRIVALASAHDLVAGHGLEWPFIKDLFTIECRPYLAKSKTRIQLEGPTAALKSTVVPSLVLAIHELVANSAKYGAFSVPEGYVEVSWYPEKAGLAILWRERNGPLVSRPTRQGFGRTLIERSLAYEFEGEVSLRFAPRGVEADFWLPDSLVLWDLPHPTESAVIPSTTMPSLSHVYAPKQVLMVEDKMLIAIDCEKMLKALGFVTIDSAPRVGTALQLLQEKQYDIGILDIDLNGENSFVIAEECIQQGIPFIFTTGFDSKYERPQHLQSAPLIQKPIQVDQLAQALYSCVAELWQVSSSP